MKRLLQIACTKALLLLSFNTNAQSSDQHFGLVDQKEVSSRKTPKIAHVGSSLREKTNVVPDIRRKLSSSSISLYPNPVIDKLMVSVDLDHWQGGSLVIKNRTGRVIAQQRIHNASVSFNLGGISRGVYFLSIRKGGHEEIIEVIKM